MWVNSQLLLATHPPGTCLKNIGPFWASCTYNSWNTTTSNNNIHNNLPKYLCGKQRLLILVEPDNPTMSQLRGLKRIPPPVLILVLLARNVQCALLIRFEQIQWFVAKIPMKYFKWCPALPQKNVPLAMATLSRSPYSLQVINHKPTLLTPGYQS